MQLLKALVIGMGVLIVLGMGLLAYGLLTKTRGPVGEGDAQSQIDSSDARGFGELALAGNAGCAIRNTEAEGRRLIITLASGSDDNSGLTCEKVIIIDMSAGSVIGSIALQP